MLNLPKRFSLEVRAINGRQPLVKRSSCDRYAIVLPVPLS
jgi:hypothetical protein